MTELHDLFETPHPEADPPSLDKLWQLGRKRRRRRRLARVGIPVVLLMVGGIAISALLRGPQESDVSAVAAGQSAVGVRADRVWVIPTFLDGSFGAFDIRVETPELPSMATTLEHADDPEQRILVVRQEVGVFEDSGQAIDINGTPGYIRIQSQGGIEIVDIEWRVDGLWQVFQTVAMPEADAIEAARNFEIGGLEALTNLGWRALDELAPQQVITIVGPSGVLLFQDEPADALPGATVLSEAGGFSVYSFDPDAPQLFVSYDNRLVFSYVPANGALPIDPAVLASSLDIVSEEQWRTWFERWSIPGETDIDEAQVAPAALTWLNQLGLAQTDVSTWTRRLRQACTQGVWEADVARRLAQEFMDEDRALSTRAQDLGPPTVAQGAKALWTMSVQVCRDAFPAGAIEAGPPSS